MYVRVIREFLRHFTVNASSSVLEHLKQYVHESSWNNIKVKENKRQLHYSLIHSIVENRMRHKIFNILPTDTANTDNLTVHNKIYFPWEYSSFHYQLAFRGEIVHAFITYMFPMVTWLRWGQIVGGNGMYSVTSLCTDWIDSRPSLLQLKWLSTKRIFCGSKWLLWVELNNKIIGMEYTDLQIQRIAYSNNSRIVCIDTVTRHCTESNNVSHTPGTCASTQQIVIFWD